MQYMYVLDYSCPMRTLILVDDEVDLTDSYIVERVLHHEGFKASQCSWLITDHELQDQKESDVVTKLDV